MHDREFNWMKLAILGTRGVPAAYGGFETFAEELGRRLVDRGHEVWVYGRKGAVDPTLEQHLGMKLVVLPCIRSKHLETVSHTLVSASHALFQGFDAALMCDSSDMGRWSRGIDLWLWLLKTSSAQLSP